jgi:hypothetical protein
MNPCRVWLKQCDSGEDNKDHDATGPALRHNRTTATASASPLSFG